MFTLVNKLLLYALVFSDCHKLVLMVLKTTIPRTQPKEITYRDYRQFDSAKFKNELKNVPTKGNIEI